MKVYTDLQGLVEGQIWEHKNGNIYQITDFVNREIGRQEEYPTTVCYQNIFTGEKYGRAVTRWHGSFTRREDLEKQETRTFDVTLQFKDENAEVDKWNQAVTATDAAKALEVAREALRSKQPDAMILWANVTGEVVGGLKLL
ncbi:MAG: hypothetical protein RIA09_16195 [Hoeflea sp.]|jgi:hypothetical protein|uniref:hypothetical protein n=1 Tax=Hoeflea sp. TaxID=1940281 RepID=UPI0032EC8A91